MAYGREDVIPVILMFVLFAVIGRLLAPLLVPQKLRQMKKYTDVNYGMSEKQMLEIIGKGYTKSSLRDGSIKYEWRTNDMSASTNFGGVRTTGYSGVKKLDIYVKNGRVIEIRPYNI